MFAPSNVVDQVLPQLNELGWEAGSGRIEEDIRATSDSARRAGMRLFLGWMAAERGQRETAIENFSAAALEPGYGDWALAGQAYVAMINRDYPRAQELLDRAATSGNADDPILRATIAHYRGAIHYHGDRIDEALASLCDALELYGPGHFGTGRVLDTLGMVYQAKYNFDAARRFFEKSIELKQRVSDLAGLALTHGNLGRLQLDWGLLDLAESHFTSDYECARRINDTYGMASCDNWQGIVALERGRWQQAAAVLQRSIERCAKLGVSIPEGFARKDYAVALLRMGELAAAAEQAERAAALFESVGFSEGLAYLAHVRGMILREKGDVEQAEERLRDGARHFAEVSQWAEAARLQLELVRTARQGQRSSRLVTDGLRQALDWAEGTRRDHLIGEIETELRDVDEAAFYRHIYRRSRGRYFPEENNSLHAGRRETATILFLDLKDSVLHSHDTDPQIIMLTFNQMMAQFSDVLKRHEAQVSSYLGDGFMAMFRHDNHALRGVAAALDLFATLPDFNLPRELLQLAPFELRIGLSTGEVSIGNAGTYDKMDYTALGTAANLAARLQSQAKPGIPCISRSTHDLVGGEFDFSDDSPRTVVIKGFSDEGVPAWDVIARKS